MSLLTSFLPKANQVLNGSLHTQLHVSSPSLLPMFMACQLLFIRLHSLSAQPSYQQLLWLLKGNFPCTKCFPSARIEPETFCSLKAPPLRVMPSSRVGVLMNIPFKQEPLAACLFSPNKVFVHNAYHRMFFFLFVYLCLPSMPPMQELFFLHCRKGFNI